MTTQIYTQLHNANIGEYVTTSKDIYDEYSGESQYEFNRSVKDTIGTMGGMYAGNIVLDATPDNIYVTETTPCTIECKLTIAGVDQTDQVLEWEIDRISVDPSTDKEWGDSYVASSKMVIKEDDLGGDTAMFVITATLPNGLYATNSVSLLSSAMISGYNFDLDNQWDSVLVDSYHNALVDTELRTFARLKYNDDEIVPENVAFDYSYMPDDLKDCAKFTSVDCIDITLTIPKGTKIDDNNALIVMASGMYNGQTFLRKTTFYIKADKDGIKYQLNPNCSQIKVSSTGVYTPTEMDCCVLRYTAKGVEELETTPDEIRFTRRIDGGDEEELRIEDDTVIKLWGDGVTPPASSVAYFLYEDGQLVDTENIYVVRDGASGDTIKLDFDNEMDAIATDQDYNALETGKIISNGWIYYGSDYMTFDGIPTIEKQTNDEDDEAYLDNVKVYTKIDGGTKLTVRLQYNEGDRVPKKFTVVVSASGHFDGDADDEAAVFEGSAKLNIVSVPVSDSTPMYYLITSANAVKVNKSNIRKPLTVGAQRMKRVGKKGYSDTSYGYVMYRIDDNAWEKYVDGNGDEALIDTESIGEQIIFEYYDENTQLLDRETVPVIFDGTDGVSGRSVKDIDEYYLATDSGDEVPSYDEDWVKNTRPGSDSFNADYPYLWNYEEITYAYADGTTEISRTTPTWIAMWSRGIDKITNYYLACAQSDGIDVILDETQAESKWWTGQEDSADGMLYWKTSMDQPDSEHPYLWNFELITFTDGEYTWSEPAIIAYYGDGQDYLNIDSGIGFVVCSEQRTVQLEDIDKSYVDGDGNTVELKIPQEKQEYKVKASTRRYAELDYRMGEGGIDAIFDDMQSYGENANVGLVRLESDFTALHGSVGIENFMIGWESSDSNVIRVRFANTEDGTSAPLLVNNKGERIEQVGDTSYNAYLATLEDGDTCTIDQFEQKYVGDTSFVTGDSHITFYVYVHPDAWLQETNYVKFRVVTPTKTLRTSYSITPTMNDSTRYCLATSHDVLKCDAMGHFVPTEDASIAVQIIRQTGDSASAVDYADTTDISLFWSFDGGEYVYVPKTVQEWEILDEIQRDKNGEIDESDYGLALTVFDYDGNKINEGVHLKEAHYIDTSLYGVCPKWRFGDILSFYGNDTSKFTQLSFRLTDSSSFSGLLDSKSISMRYDTDGQNINVADLDNDMDCVNVNDDELMVDSSFVEFVTTLTFKSGSSYLHITNGGESSMISEDDATMIDGTIEDILNDDGYGTAANEALYRDVISKYNDYVTSGNNNDYNNYINARKKLWDNVPIYWKTVQDGETKWKMHFYVLQYCHIPTSNISITIKAEGTAGDGTSVSDTTTFKIHGMYGNTVYQLGMQYSVITYDGDIRVPETMEAYITSRQKGRTSKLVWGDLSGIGAHQDLILGYSLDDENNTTGNGLQAARYALTEAQFTKYGNALFGDKADNLKKTSVFGAWPSISTALVNERIDFYLFQAENYGSQIVFTMIDTEAVYVEQGYVKTNANLLSGTWTGNYWNGMPAVADYKENWNYKDAQVWRPYPDSYSAIGGQFAIQVFDEQTGESSLYSPRFTMDSNKEFCVSFEAQFIRSEDDEDNYDNVRNTAFKNMSNDSDAILVVTADNGSADVTDGKANNNGSDPRSPATYIEGTQREQRTIQLYGSQTDSNVYTSYGEHWMGEWTKFKVCFGYDVFQKATSNACIIFKYNCSQYRLLLRYIKCEYGDVATPWCYSEEDKRGADGVSGLGIKQIVELYYSSEAKSDDSMASMYTPVFWDPNNTSITVKDSGDSDTGTNATGFFKSDGSLKNTYEYTPDDGTSPVVWTIGSIAGSGYNTIKRFLWNVEVTVGSDWSIIQISTPALICIDGRSIRAVYEFYCVTDNDSGLTFAKDQVTVDGTTCSYDNSKQTDQWILSENGKSMPSMTTKNNNLWNAEVIVYSDGTFDCTSPVIIGQFKSGVGLELTNEMDCIPVSSDGVYSGTDTLVLSTKATMSNPDATAHIHCIEVQARKSDTADDGSDGVDYTGDDVYMEMYTLSTCVISENMKGNMYYLYYDLSANPGTFYYQETPNAAPSSTDAYLKVGIKFEDAWNVEILYTGADKATAVTSADIATASASIAAYGLYYGDGKAEFNMSTIYIEVTIPAGLATPLPTIMPIRFTAHDFGTTVDENGDNHDLTKSATADDIYAGGQLSIVTLNAGADALVYQIVPNADGIQYDSTTDSYYIDYSVGSDGKANKNGKTVEASLLTNTSNDSRRYCGLICYLYKRQGAGDLEICDMQEYAAKLKYEYSLDGGTWFEIPQNSDGNLYGPAYTHAASELLAHGMRVWFMPDSTLTGSDTGALSILGGSFPYWSGSNATQTFVKQSQIPAYSFKKQVSFRIRQRSNDLLIDQETVKLAKDGATGRSIQTLYELFLTTDSSVYTPSFFKLKDQYVDTYFDWLLLGGGSDLALEPKSMMWYLPLTNDTSASAPADGKVGSLWMVESTPTVAQCLGSDGSTALSADHTTISLKAQDTAEKEGKNIGDYSSFSDLDAFDHIGRYIWNVEVMYDNKMDLLNITSPHLVSDCGKKLKDIADYYVALSSGTQPDVPTEQFSSRTCESQYETTGYTWKKGNVGGDLNTLSNSTPFLWNFSLTIYEDGTYTYTQPRIVGTYSSGFAADLSNEMDAVGVQYETTDSSAILYLDGVQVITTDAVMYDGGEKMQLQVAGADGTNCSYTEDEALASIDDNTSLSDICSDTDTKVRNNYPGAQYLHYYETYDDEKPKVVILCAWLTNGGEITTEVSECYGIRYYIAFIKKSGQDGVLNKSRDRYNFQFKLLSADTKHRTATATLSVLLQKVGDDGYVYQLMPYVDQIIQKADGTYITSENSNNELDATENEENAFRIKCGVIGRAGGGDVSVFSESDSRYAKKLTVWADTQGKSIESLKTDHIAAIAAGTEKNEHPVSNSVKLCDFIKSNPLQFTLWDISGTAPVCIDKETIPLIMQGTDGLSAAQTNYLDGTDNGLYERTFGWDEGQSIFKHDSDLPPMSEYISAKFIQYNQELNGQKYRISGDFTLTFDKNDLVQLKAGHFGQARMYIVYPHDDMESAPLYDESNYEDMQCIYASNINKVKQPDITGNKFNTNFTLNDIKVSASIKIGDATEGTTLNDVTGVFGQFTKDIKIGNAAKFTISCNVTYTGISETSNIDFIFCNNSRNVNNTKAGCNLKGAYWFIALQWRTTAVTDSTDTYDGHDLGFKMWKYGDGDTGIPYYTYFGNNSSALDISTLLNTGTLKFTVDTVVDPDSKNTAEVNATAIGSSSYLQLRLYGIPFLKCNYKKLKAELYEDTTNKRTPWCLSDNDKVLSNSNVLKGTYDGKCDNTNCWSVLNGDYDQPELKMFQVSVTSGNEAVLTQSIDANNLVAGVYQWFNNGYYTLSFEVKYSGNTKPTVTARMLETHVVTALKDAGVATGTAASYDDAKYGIMHNANYCDIVSGAKELKAKTIDSIQYDRWTKYYMFTPYNIGSESWFTIMFNVAAGDSDCVVQFRNVKLEEGLVPTLWNACADDIKGKDGTQGYPGAVTRMFMNKLQPGHVYRNDNQCNGQYGYVEGGEDGKGDVTLAKEATAKGVTLLELMTDERKPKRYPKGTTIDGIDTVCYIDYFVFTDDSDSHVAYVCSSTYMMQDEFKSADTVGETDPLYDDGTHNYTYPATKSGDTSTHDVSVYLESSDGKLYWDKTEATYASAFYDSLVAMSANILQLSTKSIILYTTNSNGDQETFGGFTTYGSGNTNDASYSALPMKSNSRILWVNGGDFGENATFYVQKDGTLYCRDGVFGGVNTNEPKVFWDEDMSECYRGIHPFSILPEYGDFHGISSKNDSSVNRILIPECRIYGVVETDTLANINYVNPIINKESITFNESADVESYNDDSVGGISMYIHEPPTKSIHTVNNNILYNSLENFATFGSDSVFVYCVPDSDLTMKINAGDESKFASHDDIPASPCPIYDDAHKMFAQPFPYLTAGAGSFQNVDTSSYTEDKNVENQAHTKVTNCESAYMDMCYCTSTDDISNSSGKLFLMSFGLPMDNGLYIENGLKSFDKNDITKTTIDESSYRGDYINAPGLTLGQLHLSMKRALWQITQGYAAEALTNYPSAYSFDVMKTVYQEGAKMLSTAINATNVSGVTYQAFKKDGWCSAVIAGASYKFAVCVYCTADDGSKIQTCYSTNEDGYKKLVSGLIQGGGFTTLENASSESGLWYYKETIDDGSAKNVKLSNLKMHANYGLTYEYDTNSHKYAATLYAEINGHTVYGTDFQWFSYVTDPQFDSSLYARMAITASAYIPMYNYSMRLSHLTAETGQASNNYISSLIQGDTGLTTQSSSTTHTTDSSTLVDWMLSHICTYAGDVLHHSNPNSLTGFGTLYANPLITLVGNLYRNAVNYIGKTISFVIPSDKLNDYKIAGVHQRAYAMSYDHSYDHYGNALLAELLEQYRYQYYDDILVAKTFGDVLYPHILIDGLGMTIYKIDDQYLGAMVEDATLITELPTTEYIADNLYLHDEDGDGSYDNDVWYHNNTTVDANYIFTKDLSTYGIDVNTSDYVYDSGAVSIVPEYSTQMYTQKMADNLKELLGKYNINTQHFYVPAFGSATDAWYYFKGETSLHTSTIVSSDETLDALAFTLIARNIDVSANKQYKINRAAFSTDTKSVEQKTTSTVVENDKVIVAVNCPAYKVYNTSKVDGVDGTNIYEQLPDIIKPLQPIPVIDPHPNAYGREADGICVTVEDLWTINPGYFKDNLSNVPVIKKSGIGLNRTMYGGNDIQTMWNSLVAMVGAYSKSTQGGSVSYSESAHNKIAYVFSSKGEYTYKADDGNGGVYDKEKFYNYDYVREYINDLLKIPAVMNTGMISYHTVQDANITAIPTSDEHTICDFDPATLRNLGFCRISDISHPSDEPLQFVVAKTTTDSNDHDKYLFYVLESSVSDSTFEGKADSNGIEHWYKCLPVIRILTTKTLDLDTVKNYGDNMVYALDIHYWARQRYKNSDEVKYASAISDSAAASQSIIYGATSAKYSLANIKTLVTNGCDYVRMNFTCKQVSPRITPGFAVADSGNNKINRNYVIWELSSYQLLTYNSKYFNRYMLPRTDDDDDTVNMTSALDFNTVIQKYVSTT